MNKYEMFKALHSLAKEAGEGNDPDSPPGSPSEYESGRRRAGTFYYNSKMEGI